MGMPPPTLASNSRLTPCRRAKASSSGPCFAITSLLAVTTCLPAVRASFRYWAAGWTPPITSTTKPMSGSARISSGLAVISRAGIVASRGLAASRTRAFFKWSGRPALAEMAADCSSRAAATPPPTTPKPSKPTFSAGASLIPARLGETRPAHRRPRLVDPGGRQLHLVGNPGIDFAVKVDGQPIVSGTLSHLVVKPLVDPRLG